MKPRSAPANPPILLLSQRSSDFEFASRLSLGDPDLEAGQVFQCKDRDEAWAFLVRFPNTRVVWDIDDSIRAVAFGRLLAEKCSRDHVCALGDKEIFDYPFLFDTDSIGHYILRREHLAGDPLYSRVFTQVQDAGSLGIRRYFPDGVNTQMVILKNSHEKIAAVDAVQNFLGKKGVNERLAALASQGTDELIMNALFDAPVDATGSRYRRSLLRTAEFELDDRELISVEVGSTDTLVGICVSDKFGSFDRASLFRYLRKNYTGEVYTVWKNDPGAGLGIYNLIHSALSMVFFCEPSARTEVHFYFPRAKGFKEFRNGFRFVSVLLPK